MIGTPLPIEKFSQSVVLDNLVDNSVCQNNPLAMVGIDQVILYGLSNSLAANGQGFMQVGN